MSLMRNDKIDFVVTWVDGSDSAWLDERKKYQDTKDGEAIGANRFRDWGLLKYWFRGVEKFAPFVGNVYFVTYGHVPTWLNIDCPRLKVVRHQDFIPKQYLPTYNSVAIELNLHRIKGLSEEFVYFNDDMFLIKEISEKTFFENGRAKYNFVESAMASYGGINRLYRDMLLNTNEVINRNFKKKPIKNLSLKDRNTFVNNLKAIGFGKYIGFSSHHSAHAFLKSTFEEIWKKEQEELERTCMEKFRTADIITPDVIELWQACAGITCNYNSKWVEKYYNIGIDSISKIKNDLEEQRYKIMCLNDECGDDRFEKTQKELVKSFEKILNEKSQFEK